MGPEPTRKRRRFAHDPTHALATATCSHAVGADRKQARRSYNNHYRNRSREE